jgi:hypothetical protein
VAANLIVALAFVDKKLMKSRAVQSVQGDKSKVRVAGNVKPEEGWMVRIPGVATATTASAK